MFVVRGLRDRGTGESETGDVDLSLVLRPPRNVATSGLSMILSLLKTISCQYCAVSAP